MAKDSAAPLNILPLTLLHLLLLLLIIILLTLIIDKYCVLTNHFSTVSQ
jgi:hypothetical protein